MDRATEVLAGYGVTGALVNGGGDMATFGHPPERDRWRIGIRHPRGGAADYFGIVRLADGAIATSGDYERGYTIGDSTYGHILDPRTARPATGCVSATVIAPTAETADALATAAFVLGPDSGRAMLERIAGAEGLIVVESDGLEAYATSGFLTLASIDTTQVRLVGDRLRAR